MQRKTLSAIAILGIVALTIITGIEGISASALVLPSTVNVVCSPSTLTLHPNVPVRLVQVHAICRAVVTGGYFVPLGRVSFTSDLAGRFLRTSCVLIRGACKVTFVPAAAGTATITANYYGDSTHSTGTNTASVIINPAHSRTLVTCFPRRVVAGTSQVVRCKAVITGFSPTGTGTFSQTGTGSVTFASGTCTVYGGRCTVTMHGAAPGIAYIRAEYSGDANNFASASARSISIAVH